MKTPLDKYIAVTKSVFRLYQEIDDSKVLKHFKSLNIYLKQIHGSQQNKGLDVSQDQDNV